MKAKVDYEEHAKQIEYFESYRCHRYGDEKCDIRTVIKQYIKIEIPILTSKLEDCKFYKRIAKYQHKFYIVVYA